ncbi:MAG: hypothetical protein HY263_08325, partial [Chloroflexi bacterium]|nr:hypothetical protein [Chloroflexota bacterium]
MAITARDFQSTSLNSTPSTAPAPSAEPQDVRPATDVDRIGIVFVHGIGTQQPAETFLDWSAPLVRMLTAWRIEHGFPPDPVVRSEFSFAGGSQPYLELDLPAWESHPQRRFVVTEAWWAAQIRAPSLGDAAAYVRRGLPRILAGIRDSYEVRDQIWSARLDQEIKGAEAAGRADSPAIRELRARGRWGWIDVLDSVQRFLSILAYVPALALGSLLLLIYAPFRL